MSKKLSKKKMNVVSYDGLKINMDLKKLLKMIKKEMEIMKKMKDKDIKKLETTINRMELTDDDKTIINMLRELSHDQVFKLSKKELSSFGRQFIPKDIKKKNICLENYTNVEKLPNRDEEWKTPVFTCEKDGKKFYVRTRRLKPMTTQDQKILEKEIKLSKKASTLGLGPKIVDIFYCENENGNKMLFIVTEAIDGSNLEEWLKTNQLTKKIKEKLNKLLNNLFKNDIIPNWIEERDIIVHTTKSNTKFYFNKYDSCKTKEDLIKDAKENAIQEIEWMTTYGERKLKTLLFKKFLLTKQITYSL